MILKRTFVAGAFVAVSGLAANAADIPMAPAPVAPVAPCICEEGFDWGGLYVGVMGDLQFVSLGDLDEFSIWLGGGARVGFNFDFGGFVVGAEGFAEYSVELDTLNRAVEAGGVVRAGVEVAGGRALVFAAAGAGVLWPLDVPVDPAMFWTFGGGLEVMATDRLSIRTDYRYQYFPDYPDFMSHNFSVGLGFHF